MPGRRFSTSRSRSRDGLREISPDEFVEKRSTSRDKYRRSPSPKRRAYSPRDTRSPVRRVRSPIERDPRDIEREVRDRISLEDRYRNGRDAAARPGRDPRDPIGRDRSPIRRNSPYSRRSPPPPRRYSPRREEPRAYNSYPRRPLSPPRRSPPRRDYAARDPYSRDAPRDHDPPRPPPRRYSRTPERKSSASKPAIPPDGGSKHDRTNAAPNNILGIFGLNLATTEDTLVDYFNRYPGFLDVKLIREYRSRQSRGFGFITFHNTDDAIYVREKCNGSEIEGKPIRLDFSVDESKSGRRGGRGGMRGGRGGARGGGGPPRRAASPGGGDDRYRERTYSRSPRR